MKLLLPLLASCVTDPSAPSEAAFLEIPAGFPAMAADLAAHAAFGDSDGQHGALRIGDDAVLFLYGDPDDVDALIRGSAPNGAVDGVLTSLRADEAPIRGIATNVQPNVFPEIVPTTAGPTDWVDVEELAADIDSEPLGPEPDYRASCSAGCGSDDGYWFAGVEAKSNGANTGTGYSCAATGTYGYNYQCVTFVDQVNHRADWLGNAYTGYWSSTTSGPYQKGLLPLASGTSYDAPLAGDTVVWSGGSYGHVAVIAAVGSTGVTVYDQNRSCGSQRCDLGYSAGSTWSISNGSCFSGTTFTPKGWLRRGWDFCAYYGLASGTSTSNWWPNDATYVSGTTSGSPSDITDYVTLNPGGTDPYLTSPKGLSIPAYSASATHGFTKFILRMQSNCTSKTVEVFFRRTTDSAFDASRSVKATFSGTGWTTVTANLSSNSNWNGTIDQIRIDPATSCQASSSTDTISLAYAFFDR